MSIFFTKHFLKKLRQRKINKVFVLETIKNPELVKPAHNFREELYKKFGKHNLKVIIVKKGKHTVVLTTHWVAKVKNRL